jgi:DNA ligase-1
MKYKEIAETYKQLEQTSSRLDKIEILAKLLEKLKREDKQIIYLIQGRVFPDYETTELGISSQLIKKALAKSTGASENEITKIWKELGDLGLVAENFVSKKTQSTLASSELTAEKVILNLRKLTGFQGKGTIERKLSLISELLTSASPIEARYIVRTILNDLRIGTGESTIRDSIVSSCLETQDKKEKKQNSDLVQEAIDKTNDISLVFEKACQGKSELENLEIIPGKPVKVMLFPKVKDIQEGFKRAGKPAAFEYKYDGFRLMISKDKEKISMFTRRMENVTEQFPDVKKYIQNNVHADSFILDSEAVGYNPETKKYQPFQYISQRIKRKYNIEKLEKELPVELNVFDILYYEGKSLINKEFGKRRKILEKIIKQKKYKIVLAKQLVTSSEKQAEKFYKQALEHRQEGLMVKNLEAVYKPGSRIGYGFKLKPEDRDFDLVITGAEYGTGKRAGWLTSYDIACKSDSEFLNIGKVSTGLKEKESEGLSYKKMTEKLKKITLKSEGRKVSVKPEIVVSVTYQNIQKSPTSPAGFALRF